jgi:glycosyltransferase involved in cell wall biosynthesis
MVHAGNPFSPDPDGIVSVQRNFVRAAPAGFSWTYLGVGRPGVEAVDPAGRIRFEPLISSRSQRPLVPLAARFGARLATVPAARLDGSVLRFDRFEPLLAARGRRGPKVLFLHLWSVWDTTGRASDSRWVRLGGLYARSLRAAVRTADLVYVLHERTAEEIALLLPAAEPKLRRFGVPVDTELFRPAGGAWRPPELEGLGIAPGARIVAFAGRLEVVKRPLFLPAIARALADRGRDVHVVVAGTGTLEAELATEVARLAPGRVHLLGSMPQDRLAAVLRAADGFVLPSGFEALPNVVLEALASGIPVVASSSARGAGTILTEGTGLVAGDEPETLAAGLDHVLGWDRGQAARRCRSVAERFGAAALNAPIYDAFAELAAWA